MNNYQGIPLEPCPFCDSAVEFVYQENNNWYTMIQTEYGHCDLHVGCYAQDMTPEEFIKRWNGSSKYLHVNYDDYDEYRD